MLQPDIIAHIHVLGGDIAGMTGLSLADDLCAIRFGWALHFMLDFVLGDGDASFCDLMVVSLMAFVRDMMRWLR